MAKRHGYTFLPQQYVDYTYDVKPSRQLPNKLAEYMIPKYQELVEYWTSAERTVKGKGGVAQVANEAARHARTLVQLYRTAGKLPYYRPRHASEVIYRSAA